jgi:hypothetical protein
MAYSSTDAGRSFHRDLEHAGREGRTSQHNILTNHGSVPCHSTDDILVLLRKYLLLRDDST